MKRSWRVSVVVLVFAVVAAACTGGGGNDQNNGNSSGSSGPIKLTMWMGYTPPPPVNQSFEYLSSSGWSRRSRRTIRASRSSSST